MGEPIARFLLERGYEVVGVDSSPTMIEMCRARFPGGRWLVADMRDFALGVQFHGIIAWDSFFHLRQDEQRDMFSRFTAHALPGAPLLFTTGPEDGEAIGTFGGEALYHSSLAPEEYRELLVRHGFVLRDSIVNDPDCGDHTVWLAIYQRADQG